MEQQRPQIVKSTLKNKNKSGGIMLSNYKPYYKVAIIKKIGHWH